MCEHITVIKVKDKMRSYEVKHTIDRIRPMRSTNSGVDCTEEDRNRPLHTKHIYTKVNIVLMHT